MPTVKSLDELKRLKEEALAKRQAKATAGSVQVTVAMGTCGIAAGARETMRAILDTIEADALSSVIVKQTGCIDCHSMSVYRIHNLTAVAPDLSIAVEDVPRRFGVPLEEFLHAPTGTMSMVLSSRIPMTREQRQLAIDRLKEAYREHQEARGVVLPVASH